MLGFFKRHRNKFLNVLSLAAPIVAGVVGGGVLTVPVLVAAVGSLAGKLAATPIDHSTNDK